MPSSAEGASNKAETGATEDSMDSDIEFLEHIFEQMKRAGLIETKAEFSQTLLGKGPSYLTSMSARERCVPMEVLDQMSIKLLDRTISTNAAIAEMETALSQIMAQAHRQGEIRSQFEEHRRKRLGIELSGMGDCVIENTLAPTTSRFIRAVLRKAGLVKMVNFHGDMSPARTLH
jgi:hypothetical protein